MAQPEVKARIKPSESVIIPPLFRVIYINDNQTSQEFVIESLIQHFRYEPDAAEKMSYGMPCFSLKQNVVYFAAFKNHIGFYPTASGVKAFEQELVGLKFSKGAIQFSLDKPIPKELIQKIVLFRLEEIDKK